MNSTLYRAATHCNSLQLTATHCNTLQHIATHCNTPIECTLRRNALFSTDTCTLPAFVFVYVCVCVCVCVCMCVCVCVFICTYVYTYIHHVYTYIYMYIHVCKYIYQRLIPNIDTYMYQAYTYTATEHVVHLFVELVPLLCMCRFDTYMYQHLVWGGYD